MPLANDSGCHLIEHASMRELIGEMMHNKNVSLDAVGRVVARLMVAAPNAVSQSAIAEGEMLVRPKGMTMTTVARAIGVLKKQQLVTMEARQSGGSGGPVIPLRLGSDRWVLGGVHIEIERDEVVELTVAIVQLCGIRPIESTSLEVDHQRLDTVGEQIVGVIQELMARVNETRGFERSKLIGVGMEAGAPVRSDDLIAETGFYPTNLAVAVSDGLRGVSVVVENDANALAIQFAYQSEFPDFALACVFHGGIGGALVSRGRLRRGAHGVAGEIGHLTVDYDPPPGAQECWCGGSSGHLDAIATPKRLEAMLNGQPIQDAALQAQFSDAAQLSKTAQVFRRGGQALGRALAQVITYNDPGRVLLLMPSSLANGVAGRAGSSYLEAVEEQVHRAFLGTPSDKEPWKPRVIAWDHQERRLAGAQAAAFCFLHSVVEHARGRDVCSSL